MYALEDPWIIYSKSLIDNANKPALVAGDDEITYGQLHVATASLSRIPHRKHPTAHQRRSASGHAPGIYRRRPGHPEV